MNTADSLASRLEDLKTTVKAIAKDTQSDYKELLTLLRVLEALHREVRTGYFEPALPNTRKQLYALLREMEEQGGWPYIERGKLQAMVSLMELEDHHDGSDTDGDGSVRNP